jgi:hypothetical protein
MVRKMCVSVVVAVAAFALGGCAQIAAELPNAIKESQKPPLVTPAEFKQVEKGMTPEQVEQIVGAPPTDTFEIPRQDGKSEQSIEWANYDGSTLFIGVVDGEVVSIKGYKLDGTGK